jgi:hypothetical protein
MQGELSREAVQQQFNFGKTLPPTPVNKGNKKVRS